MKIDKNYPQLYLDKFKYKTEKKKMVIFSDAELDLDDSGYSDGPNFE